jgi:hypothetical protein
MGEDLTLDIDVDSMQGPLRQPSVVDEGEVSDGSGHEESS